MPNQVQGEGCVAKPLATLDAAERAAWSGLVDRHSGNRYAFLSPVYADAVDAAGIPVTVLVFYRDGRSVAFMALQRRPDYAGRLGAYEPVGGVMSDYFGLVAEPGFQVDMPAAMRSCGVPVIAFTHLDEGQLQHGLSAEQPRIGLKTVIEEPTNEFWSRLRQSDKKFVNDTERRERKLVNDHGALRFELESSSPQEDLAWVVERKCAQYGRTARVNAPLFYRCNVDLLFHLLEAKSPQCRGVLSTLKVGDQFVAAHFGLRCHDVLHNWFPVYDPVFSSYSPGRILLRHIIEAIVGEGVRVMDRGEGDTPAKRDFANREHFYYRGLWSAGGLSAFPARSALSLIWRLG